VSNLLWLERTMMYTGRLEQGFQAVQQALALARETEHPPTLTWAMVATVNWLFLLERWQEAKELAQEATELSERYQIKPRIGQSRLIQGRALVASGRVAEGAALMRSGVDLWLEASSVLTATLMVTGPASAMAAVGDVQEVQHYLDIGERLMRTTEERLGLAENLRLRSWVLSQSGDNAGARAVLGEALAVSRRQGTRLFELRSALDLVKLNQGTEYDTASVVELKRAVEGFSEGFDFPVLVGARRVLEARGVTLPGV
jgi:tetratricopeptide (TPR) repeat protein